MAESISKEASPDATPEKHQLEQFKKGAQLFEEALQEFQASDVKETEKRQKFKGLMQEAACVMSETAAEACKEKQSLQKAEKQLEKDFQDFHENFSKKYCEGLIKNCEALQKDIRHIQQELS